MSRSLREKPTKGLLLSLMVVLVMVVGAFGMAINRGVVNDSDMVAANELESGTREIDTTPIHAQDQVIPIDTKEPMGDLSWASDAAPDQPTRESTDEMDADSYLGSNSEEMPLAAIPISEIDGVEKVPDTDGTYIDDSPDATPPVTANVPTPSVTANAPTPPGTMATVDANGPYGTIDDPYYEGDDVPFTGTLTGGDPTAFDYRWDVDNDGDWDTPGTDGWQDEIDYLHHFTDNSLTGATLEAWDYSYTTTSGYLFGDLGVSAMYYSSSLSQWNEGLRITPLMDLTITELGAYRYEPAPRHIPYRMGLWTSGGTLLRDCYLSTAPGSNVWRYCSIAPYPLSAGTTYVVSYHTQPSNYRFWMSESAINPDVYNYIDDYEPGYVYPSRYRSSSAFLFPSYTAYYTCSGDCLAAVDIVFEYTTPNIISDTADTFVDNRNPIITDMSSDPVEGEEGTAMTFNGYFSDMGTDDEWESRWCFPNGCTGWTPVRKYAGGARILLATTWSYGVDTAAAALIAAELGPFAIAIDTFDWGPVGANAPPDLDYMLTYDVVLVGTNYVPSTALAASMGDRLAEYVMAGGNVVQMWSSFHTADRITGDWTGMNFNPIVRGSLYYSWENLGAFVPHPIMNGVTSFSAYYHHNSYSENIYASWVADYVSGRTLAAVTEVGQHPDAPDSRICGLAYWPNAAYVTGDAFMLLANTIKYCSQQGDPVQLEMPLPVEPATWAFPDDHPLHVTTQDMLDATLEVRDDDHGKSVPIGGVTTILDEDFSSGTMPPPGWIRSGTWYMDWILSYSTNAGGTSPEAAFVYYNGYGYIDYGRLSTGPIDTSGFGALDISFKEYLNHYSGPYTLMVETSPDGATWTPVWQVVNPSGYSARTTTFTTSTNIGIPTTYFSWTFYGDPWNLNYWFVDDIYSVAFEAYILEGLGSGTMQVLVKNVEPTAIVPPELQNKVVDEMTTISFDGIELTDPALNEETEFFWYRTFFGDGTQTDWTYMGSLAPPKLKILVYHSLDTAGGPALQAAIQGIMPEGTIVDAVDFYTTLVDEYYMTNYDVVVVGVNLAPFDADAVGDALAAYADMGGNVIETVATFYTTCGWWGVCGDWRNNGYTTMGTGGIGGNQAVSTIYDPEHPIIKGEFGTVTTFSGGIPVSVTSAAPGSTLLADYPSYTAIAYNDLDNPNPGLGRTVGINVFYYPGYYGNNELVLLANAIWWAAGGKMPSPVIPTIDHDYGDNGIYTADVQMIDDDMNWVWDLSDPTPDPPVWVGPGDPVVSHNYIPIEVNNVAPLIEDISAYVEGDLCLRLSGNKGNEATLEVFDGTDTHSLTLIRDPNEPEFGCLEDLKINVEMSAGAYVKVIYTPSDDDGANPTWITEGYWPGADPHKIKVTFNSKKGVQEKYVSWGDLLVGDVPINFEVTMSDPGSDAIGVIWDWGDTTPFGIHVYDALTQAMCGGANEQLRTLPDGTPSIFTGCDEPIFIKDDYGIYPGNNIRSPDMGPVSMTDLQQHIFGQYYLYYLMVTVADDDNNEGYSSPPWTDGIDMGLIQIDLRK